MDFKGSETVFRCVPDVLGIRDEALVNKKAKPVTILLKRFSQPEISQAILEQKAISDAYNPSEALGKIDAMTIKDIEKKFVGVENLTVDGEEIKTFADFYNKAPAELVSWVMRAVYSAYILSEAELKN